MNNKDKLRQGRRGVMVHLTSTIRFPEVLQLETSE